MKHKENCACPECVEDSMAVKNISEALASQSGNTAAVALEVMRIARDADINPLDRLDKIVTYVNSSVRQPPCPDGSGNNGITAMPKPCPLCNDTGWQEIKPDGLFPCTCKIGIALKKLMNRPRRIFNGKDVKCGNCGHII